MLVSMERHVTCGDGVRMSEWKVMVVSVRLRHGSRGRRVILERQVGGIWVERRNVRDITPSSRRASRSLEVR